MSFLISLMLIFLAAYLLNKIRINHKKMIIEKQVILPYLKIAYDDSAHFNHYWNNPDTQVVAFSPDWEIAGKSKKEIWKRKLTPQQKKQPFIWVYPPRKEGEEPVNYEY